MSPPPVKQEEKCILKMNLKRCKNRFQTAPVHAQTRSRSVRSCASLHILLCLPPQEVAARAHLLPRNESMEPVRDHTGAEGRAVLLLKRPTKVHHQSRKLIQGDPQPAKRSQKCLRHTQALGLNISKSQLKHQQVEKILMKESPGRKVASP